jgi:hypothetical protein
MPFKFEIDKAANTVRETWTGNVTLAELKDSTRQEWAHPDFHPDMHMLSDFRSCVVEISTEQMWGFVSFMSQQDTKGRHALVVSREVGFGLARMYSSISEGLTHNADKLQVFYDYAEAEAWLKGARAQPAMDSKSPA